MATNQIKCNKGAIVKEINGVKYFKLISHYNGDYTKNCGLLANEIDENFFFLRSYDIETAEFNDKNELVLTRVDGDKIIATLPDLPEILFKKIKFEFDKEHGTIIVTYPDGTQETMEGFLVAGQDIKVATDYTLRGDGTICNPLRLSEVERTGTYAPALFFYDRTDDSAMPDGNEYGKGFRIVTKEKYEPFGRLYNYDGINAIQKALEEIKSPWRVPTREDWGDMLNSAEYCPECRDHDSEYINEWKGCIAGQRAKSTTSWDEYDGEDDGNPTKGIDNLPMTGSNGTFHVIPVGYAEGSRGTTIRDEDYDIEGLKRIASFWSITPTGSGRKSVQPNVFTRSFSYDSTHVLEESSKPYSRLSLRLVKDYTYDCTEFYEYENILGYPVPCVLISNPETHYSQIWTSVNIGFPDDKFSGVTGNEWSALTGEDRQLSERYYINEWNGKEWIKKQMNEGDSVVLIEGIPDISGNSAYNHEWRVYKVGEGEYELIDTLEALKDEFSKEFERIDGRLDDLEARLEKEIEDRIDGDLEIWSALTEEIAEREAGDELLSAVTVDLQEEIDRIEAGAGLDEDGNYIPKENANYIGSATSINEAVNTLDDELQRVEDKLDDEIDRSKFIDDNIATDIIGAEGDPDSGYTIDFYDADWKEVTEDECEMHPHDVITGTTTPPEAYDWTGTDYVECIEETPEETIYKYYKHITTNNYISDAETVVDAIKALDAALKDVSDELEDEIARAQSAETMLQDEIDLLDEKLDEEIERAQSAETYLQEQIDAEVERAMSAETWLDGQDIADEGHTVEVVAGNESDEIVLVLSRNNGNQIQIVGSFDGNFGELPPIN